MAECALAYTLCKRALACAWFDLRRRGEEFELDLSMFWLDLERNRQGRKMSKCPAGSTTAPASKERGNAAFTEQFTSAVPPAHLQLNGPTSQRWKRNLLPNLTSLVKQRAQRGARPASESSLSSSWMSGRASDCWQPALLCCTDMLAHFPDSKKSLMRKNLHTAKNICLNNSHIQL